MQHIPYEKLITVVLKTVFIVSVLIGIVLIYGFIKFTDYKSKNTELLQDNGWSYFPGSIISKNGIHFQPLNRVIVHQDGSVGQPNPPVNIGGQYLKVDGDFKITAKILKIDKQASLRLYASLPIVYDQWRYETPSIDISIDVINDLITLRIWNGSSSTSVDMRTYAIPPSSEQIISLEHTKDQIIITNNGHLLGSMPDHNLFNDGTIWFGTDGVIGSNGWTLAWLQANGLSGGTIEWISTPLMIVDQDMNDLRHVSDVHQRKIKIGTTVAVGRLFADAEYKEIALGQFNIITPENIMKPQFIQPSQNVYTYEEADLLVDIALKNNMIVHGHALLYDKSSPEWMMKSPKEERKEIMISHIENVVGHFKGKVAQWDVINEPFSKKNALYKNGGTGLEPNIWFEAMSEEYIDLAFKTARQADPSAKLYLNDYGIENDGQHWDAFLGLVKRLIKRGVPIDGVGFQAHVYGDGDYINAEQLKKHMQALNKLGLLTRISEIDVTGDDPKEQINQYVTALDVCLRAPNCTSYTTWGITDKYGSTTRSDRYPLVYGTSLLWDKDMKAKPAYYALQNRLQQDY